MILLWKSVYMLLAEEIDKILRAYIGKPVSVLTKDNQKNKTFTGTLIDFQLWGFVTVSEGICEGNVPFFGRYDGITKINDWSGKTIFENPYLKDVKFPEVTIGTPDKGFDKVNEMRRQCFGPGHDIDV